MFTLKRTRLGATYRIGVLYINETLIEQAIEDISIQATVDGELLDLFNIVGSMRFVTDSTEYIAPFSGEDFLEEKTGVLYVTITENLDPGIYRTYLVDYAVLPGVCGYGVLGAIQGGNRSMFILQVPVVVQVQSLPQDWRTEVALAAQPFAVSTIIRP